MADSVSIAGTSTAGTSKACARKVRAGAKPRVWVLLGAGAGGNAQMLALADALGWPYAAKQMRYNWLNHLPNLVLGATAISVDRARSDALDPPWPDLVIAASRRAAPVARWIKARSGGRTRLVHLLHTQAPLHHFDLVVTLAQYRLPRAPNVQHNTLPLNHIDDARLRAAAARWAAAFAARPRPWIAVLVGGNSSSYRLDSATAKRLGELASERAAAAGGSLLVTTSRRTPAHAARVLEAAITAPAFCYRWAADDADNPYPAFIALADYFIVTADSASLPAEAAATGRPVELFDWRVRHRSRMPSPTRLPLAKSLHNALIYWGLIKPARDFAAYHGALKAAGLVGYNPPLRAPPDDLGATVARVRELLMAA